MSKRKSPSSEAPELRIRAERRLRDLKTARARPATEQDALRLLHELQVHQVELEMQNEELLASRKEVEAGLKRYTDLYDFAPVGYFTMARDGTIRKVNITGADLLGVHRSRLVGRKLGRFVAPDELGRWDRHLATVLQSGEQQTCELTLKREDGSTLCARLESIRLDGAAQEDPSADPSPEIRVAMGDITGRKRAEEEHRVLAAKVQEAQKLESMGVLAGGIAHDLNNLLTAVIANAQLALHELPPGVSARGKIERAIASAHRAAELAEQVLAYSGKGQFVVRPVGLSELLRGMSRLLKAAIPRQCSLEYCLGKGLPTVEADPGQVRRVAIAVVLNAAEAMGQKRGVISVSTGVMKCDQAYLKQCANGEYLAPGSYVYLEVKDSGCGMAPEVRSRLFEPFFSTKAFGRGLGLPAAIGIVRSHHGAIHVATKPGGGSAFRVILPASASAVGLASVGEPDKAPPLVGGAGKVLVVDDEDDVREVAQAVLQVAGFTVLTAAGGREAIELCRKNSADIDAVLLDLTMPDMDGYETFCELRKIRKDLRVLLCSGYGLDNAQERFGNEEMPGFLKKPFEMRGLVDAIRQVMRGPGHTPVVEASTTRKPMV